MSDATTQQAISAALEHERQRITAQLQMTVSAQLKILLAQIRAYEQSASATNRSAFAVIASLARNTMQQLHDLEQALAPPALTTRGLATALETFTSQQRRRTGAAISLTLQQRRERYPQCIELAIYRTVQAIITTALDERQASYLVIQIKETDNAVQVNVHDDGLPHADHTPADTPALLAVNGQMQNTQSRYGGLQHTLTIKHIVPVDLTPREREVIAHLTGGMTNKEIAVALGIQPRTIKFHLDNIYSKLGISTRTEAAIYALQQGWIPD